ncbi:MAG: diaminopimelate decarboxylase [Chloroflexota bacterium]|jgi:diaminopimelate decarboxylase|nr:diaminopimelate decarboxylase [Chloroflexota bacterium]
MTAVMDAAVASEPRIVAGERLAGVDPQDLAGLYGTPFFLYDLDVLADRVALLRRALPPNGDLAFAVKANPSLAVLSRLARLGVGADVASAGELQAAIRAGIALERIVFTGPGKTDAELGGALRLGVRAITVESLDELDALIELAGVAHPGQGLMLRLAVDGHAESTPIIGAGSAKFGLLPEEVDEAIDRLHRSGAAFGPGSPYQLLGLHAFGASNVLDADALLDGIRSLAERAEAVSQRHGLPIQLLDGGGGLGIPYGDDQQPLDLERLRDGLATETASWVERPALARARLVLEPGRWLAGPIGAYVVRVVRVKPRGDRVICVVDGGIHQLVRPALIGQSQRVVRVGAAAVDEGRPERRVDVVGPLCTGLDVLATDVRMPEPRTGDLLCIMDTGAYGFTESMPLFLSHPQPAELVAANGRAGAARLRSEPADGLSRQLVPFR